jgi:hypothetical protein
MEGRENREMDALDINLERKRTKVEPEKEKKCSGI